MLLPAMERNAQRHAVSCALALAASSAAEELGYRELVFCQKIARTIGVKLPVSNAFILAFMIKLSKKKTDVTVMTDIIFVCNGVAGSWSVLQIEDVIT